MALDTHSILDPIRAHAAALGVFDTVGGHEPKRAPGTGLTFALWVDRINPVPSSGLTSTSIRFTVLGRIYGPMLAEPQDEIDPVMSDAAARFISALAGDLELNGPDGSGASVARSVDVRGIHGVDLSAQAGYIEQDRALYRVYTITVPVLVNDVYDEAR